VMERSRKPDLSVIIAYYHSGDLIEGCLESLACQDTDRRFETLVVDSSEDDAARQVRKRFPEIAWYRFSERKFCGDARNFGISVAGAEIIAFLDADCRAEKTWVSEILRAHQSPDLAIGGPLGNGNPESALGWAAYFCEFSQWMPGRAGAEMADIPGANMSYKKKAFEIYGTMAGGTYCSDTEFHWRLLRGGHRLRFVPTVLVLHHNIDRLGRYLKHEYQHGRSFGRIRMRFQNFSMFRKWLYVTFSFLLPLWLFAKIGMRNLTNRVYLVHFLKTWPLLLPGLIAWSLGEFTGYLRTPPGGKDG
jgi:GT2 family glycosyltransferase